MKRNSGMTLLEVLMVTGLLSFVALSVFVSVRSMVDAKRTVDSKSESTQEFRAILSLMTRDVQTAFFNTAADFI
ncbi:MAG TPA: type II secretion system protein, partial [Bdellovibrionota bacterium]|nr:type II secretion system protein [Bdellovibrionota bacterium]